MALYFGTRSEHFDGMTLEDFEVLSDFAQELFKRDRRFASEG